MSARRPPNGSCPDSTMVCTPLQRQVRLSPAQRVELGKYRDALRSTIHSVSWQGWPLLDQHCDVTL